MMYRSPKVKQYRRYRKAGIALHQKIIEKYVDDKIIGEAARELELGENHELNLDTEDDLSVLMEFAIYEIKDDESNFVEKYQKEVGGRNRVERDLLAAKIKGTTGLFIVRDIWRERYNVGLVDLHDEGKTITLTDINFSQSIIENVIVFFRPTELPEFTTTSGVSFVFPADMEIELKEKWDEWESLGSAKRYANVFRLYKSQGMPTLYT